MQQHSSENDFETLFRKEYPRLVRVISRVLDRGMAEDVAQEAFAKLHRQPSLDLAQARNLLYRIALNAALSARRSELRRAAREQRFSSDDSDGPEDLMLRFEARDSVRQVLTRLSKSQASVLILRYSGYSYREIADFLSLSPNHVGVLLHRAEIAFEKEYARVTSA